MMPDMDGIELLRELKKAGYRGKLALVSSLDQMMINSARKLGDMHGLNIIGTCRKPLRKAGLDALFLTPEAPRGQLTPSRTRASPPIRLPRRLKAAPFARSTSPR